MAGCIPQMQPRSDAMRARRIAKTWTLSELSEFVQVSILCEGAQLTACSEDKHPAIRGTSRAGSKKAVPPSTGRFH